ncbi:hypothetical protein JTE90_001156 [Oedothorax gibbosus]|uniref:BTB domain-containing protein n=1 Tax=Oedothorax gibbosus TaxID=931172 RepID=A0AAV6VHB0_9ARAC|nr:hypothetical protein JTE90_001156 [Oedothorax gibbosus]
MLPHQRGKYLKSANFTTHIFDGVYFHLKLYPRGVVESEDDLSCFLQRSKIGASPIQVGFSLTLQAVESFYDKEFSNESVEFANSTAWGFNSANGLELIHKDKCTYLPKDVLTLHCVLWSPGNKAIVPKLMNWNAESPCNYKFSSRTQIQVNKRCMTWPIAKVQQLRASFGKVYCLIEQALQNTPKFELSFSFSEDSNCEHAQIIITQCSRTNHASVEDCIFVKCNIIVMSNCEEIYQLSQEDTCLFEPNAPKAWHFPNFIATAELEAGKHIHMDDTLYLLCEFSFSFQNSEVSHTELPSYSESVFRLPEALQTSNLSRSIKKFYTDATFCNVTVKVENHTFPAQKLILCAQSPVFHAMFTNDTKEKNTNVVEIEDIDDQTMKIMLEYLHTDAIVDEDLVLCTPDDISWLYLAANKYQISHLKQYCIQRLLSIMAVDNIDDILTFADRYQEHFLMSYAQYFLKTCGIEIFQTETWYSFLHENPSLCGKIMIQAMKNV